MKVLCTMEYIIQIPAFLFKLKASWTWMNFTKWGGKIYSGQSILCECESVVQKRAQSEGWSESRLKSTLFCRLASDFGGPIGVCSWVQILLLSKGWGMQVVEETVPSYFSILFHICGIIVIPPWFIDHSVFTTHLMCIIALLFLPNFLILVIQTRKHQAT